MVNEVSEDTKSMIAKVIALQALATEPGQKLQMTSAVMNSILAGLVIKYGEDRIPEARVKMLQYERDTFFEAMSSYTHGEEFWGKAMMQIHDIASSMITIAAAENLMDYKQFEYNFTRAGLSMIDPSGGMQQGEDDENPARRAIART